MQGETGVNPVRARRREVHARTRIVRMQNPNVTHLLRCHNLRKAIGETREGECKKYQVEISEHRDPSLRVRKLVHRECRCEKESRERMIIGFLSQNNEKGD